MLRRLIALPMIFVCVQLSAAGSPESNSSAMRPQSLPAAAEQAHHTTLPTVADGELDPEAIPLDVAYRHWIKSLAAGTPHAGPMRERQLQRVGLSHADQRLISPLLEAAGQTLDRLETDRRLLTEAAPLDDARHAELRARVLSTLDKVRSDMLARLSVEGRERVESFVRSHVRQRIKIYGEMPRR